MGKATMKADRVHVRIDGQWIEYVSVAEYERLKYWNERLRKVIRGLIEQWKRQKGLFPVLKQDGWMDLAVRDAETVAGSPE